MPDIIQYGPDSEPYNIYPVNTHAPGDNGVGGQIAQRGRHPFGQQLILVDGRKYRFCLGGTGTMVPGEVQQAAAALGTSEDLTPVAAAVNSRIIDFTHGAATTVVNLFAEGYATISVTPGFGQIYKIASHAALRNATAGDIVNLAPGNGIRVALTGSSRVDLSRHPYAGLIVAQSAVITGVPVGVALAAILDGGTGWVQTRGAAAVLTNGSLIVGTRAIVPGAADAGAVSPETAVVSDSDVEITLGTVLTVAATGAVSTIFLMIDG